MKLNQRALALAIATSEKSQAEIAKDAGMNPAHFSRVVNGFTKPELFTIGKIARALKLPVESIIKED